MLTRIAVMACILLCGASSGTLSGAPAASPTTNPSLPLTPAAARAQATFDHLLQLHEQRRAQIRQRNDGTWEREMAAERFMIRARDLVKHGHYAQCLSDATPVDGSLPMSKQIASATATISELLGPDDIIFAVWMLDLATAYNGRGAPGDAQRMRDCAAASVERFERLCGDDLPNYYISSAILLADASQACGDLDQADRFYRRAQRRLEDFGRQLTYQYADLLNNLGRLAMRRNDPKQSRRFFRTALNTVLALRQDGDSRQLQSLHADVLVGFSNMVHAREYANIEALQLKFQAFEIHRQMMRENPTVSSSRQIRDLIAMGELARELKELELKDYRQISDDGEAALRRACDACDRVYRSHPIALSAAAHYALSQFLRYRNDSARDDRRQSLAELETTIRIREAINSNDPMQRMWLLTARLDAARQKGDAAAGERLAADMLVFAPQLPGAQAYAAWLRLQLATFQAAQGHNSAAEATFAAALEQLHGEMEQGLARHAATRQLQVLRTVRCSLDYYCSFHRRAGCLGEKTYAQVLMWKGSLFERQRAERAADESRQAPASQPVPADEPRAAESAAKLCAMLPENAALLDFIRYVDFLPPTNEAGAKNKGTLRYLAFVLRHDGLTAFDLGPADPIEKAVRQWREGRRFAPQDALRVRDMVLPPPLRQKLAGARLLLISPDAILSALPFAALPESDDPREGYLIEHMAIANVLAPKLFRPAASSAGTAAANHISALLVGAVDYGRATPSATTSAAEIRGRRLRFDALDSTGAEIENLRGTFMAMAADTQVETLAGAAATPLAFCRDAVGKRFIHIATHGYCTADLKTFSPVGGLVDVEPGSMPTIVDPGSRTGLALAGANLTPAPDDDSAEHGGLLTAAQVADLDLRGTDLVVLSACDTALGSPVAGEGLLGLQRAFQIGGSRAVVASLWPVGDQSTATLMGIMYRKLLQEHREPILALRDAQLAILNMNQSPAAAERGAVPGAARTLASSTIAPDRRPSPAIWAPWVLSGDPGDLNVILHQLESPIPPARALPHVANHKWNSAFITDAVVCAAVIVMLAGIMMARRARRASRR